MKSPVNPLLKIGTSSLALVTALAAASLLLVLLGSSPGGALKAFYLGPVSTALGWGNWLNEACLLTLTGLGASVAFTAGRFNLGGEGQTYFGAWTCAALGLLLPPLPSPLGLLLALAAGVLGGALAGGTSGYLKARWDADELITSFLLSAALLPLVDSLITLPALTDPRSFLITTRTLDPSLGFPGLLAPSSFHAGDLLVLPVVLILAFVLTATPWGFRLRITGRNQEFARYAGIPVARFAFFPLLLSGALHGLAGALAVLGSQHALVQNLTAGWGWNGIAVALIARSRPWAVVPAALFFAFLDQAARNAVLQGQFPFQLGAVFQALILFFITAQIVVFKRRHRAQREVP